MSREIEMIGRKFGKLTVISSAPKVVTTRSYKYMWNCICSCGCKTIAEGYNLRSHHTTSCGCGKDGSSKVTHGHKRQNNISPTYSTWRNMWNRCTNPNVDNYMYYGGRGITICERWKDFKNFLEDMGERPEGMFIDRKDNDGDYSPDNCKWSTMKEQNNNKNPYITFKR
jgi:hypothetical protein